MTLSSTRSETAFQNFRRRGLHENQDNQDGWMVSFADMITLLFLLFSLLLSISVISRSKFELLTHQFNQAPPTDLSQIQSLINQEIEKLGLQSSVTTFLSDEGLVLQFLEGVLFASGEAALSSQGLSTLRSFAVVLMKLQQKNNNFHLAIEGHTDDQPIRNQKYQSNWELSSSRAINVLHLLKDSGLQESLLIAKAFASTRPLAPAPLSPNINPPESLETFRAKNRRVSLLVY